VLVLGHWFLSALHRQIQFNLHPGDPARPWRWHWSAGLYAATWILFAIAFGSSGVFRHTAWLLNYNQPWYERRLSSLMELMNADHTIRNAIIDNDQDFDATRKAVLVAPGYWNRRNPFCEDFNAIFYGDSGNKVAAYLIIPREPKLLAKGDFAISLPTGGMSRRPLSDLPQVVSELDAKYPIKASQ
jgi:hypothetical protein